jgi:hypothetical protein
VLYQTNIHCPHHETTQWVLKTNRKGLEHAMHCEARIKANKSKKSGGDPKEKALSSVMENQDANGASGDDDEVAEEL